jgi:molybdenum cofactor synthesis domain-containing protein
MKTVPVEDAEGLILCHDITEIADGGKQSGFRRGHRVRREDIPHLLRIGKRNLYVWDTEPGLVHEDDAALRIAAAIAGPGTICTEPLEGRINLTAACQGLLTINLDLLARLNSILYVTIATKRSLREVARGDFLAGTRVTPLAVPESTVALVEDCCRTTDPLIAVQPFLPRKIGLIITGSEIYSGKVEDAFGPVLRRKFAAWGAPVISQEIVPDEPEQTIEAIRRAMDNGAQVVVVSGGMSVDPDDKTPAAIRTVGGEVVTYGAPVFPGAMFMLAYRNNIPILGLPGCVMYRRATIFDLIMPRILAGKRITPHDITGLAHGGLCDSCPECTYPQCGFGA